MTGTGIRVGIGIATCSVLVFCLGPACGRSSRDPRTLLPADSDVLVSFPSVVQARDEAGLFFERVPEAAGLLEWMRSLGGIDLRSADRTREEGWDPGRPWGAAWRAGEWWITLPVEAEGKVRRRLGLRMARLGMVARESPGPGVFFQDLRDPRRRAWALVEGGVARICLSGEDGCQAPPPPGADPGGIPARIEAVAREAGLERPALVFRIAGDARMRLLPKAWRSRWPGGLAGQVAWAAVGEIRGAIQWAPSPVIRVLAGAPGEAVEPPGPVPPLGSGEVAGLALDLGPWMSAIRGSAGDLGLSREAGEFLRGAWDGRLRLSVGEGGPATGSSPLSWRERFPLGAGLGVRQDQGFFREVGVPVAGGPGTGEGTVEQAPPGTDLRFVLPVLGEVRGVLAGGEIRVTAGRLDPGALPGDSLELEGGLIAWMRVDWQRVVRGLGGDSLGLPGHLAAVIREVRGRVFRQGARVVVEAGLSGWQEADR